MIELSPPPPGRALGGRKAALSAGSGLDSWPPQVNSWLSDLLANSRVMTPVAAGRRTPLGGSRACTGFERQSRYRPVHRTPGVGLSGQGQAAQWCYESPWHAAAAAHLSPSPGVTESSLQAPRPRPAAAASRLGWQGVGRGSGLDSWPPQVNSWLSDLLVNSREMTPVAAGRRLPRVPGLYRL
jgi:hypothetical protein